MVRRRRRFPFHHRAFLGDHIHGVLYDPVLPHDVRVIGRRDLPVFGWFNAGSVIPVSASASPGFVFTSFSGALTGSATPQSLTLNAPASVTANFSAQSSSSWYSTGGAWSNRKAVTIDHTRVSGSLSNFPVVISITDANLQASAKPDGSDILFTAADGLTKLNHQLDSYNSSTGQLIAWVSVPALSSAANTTLYLYYGNPTASPQQNPSAVWDSNYLGVWRLPNGSTLSASDSTSNAFSGVVNGVIPTAGVVGGGASNPSANHSITFTGPNPGATATFEFWINPTGASSNDYGGVLTHNSSSASSIAAPAASSTGMPPATSSPPPPSPSAPGPTSPSPPTPPVTTPSTSMASSIPPAPQPRR